MSSYHKVEINNKLFHIKCPRDSINDPMFLETITGVIKDGVNLPLLLRSDLLRLRITHIKEIQLEGSYKE